MPEINPSRFTVECGWDDVPHLDARTKAELLGSYEPHMREARSQGIPSLGAGAIYPVSLKDILIDPFEMPDYWPRGYALDVGWKRTAALWGAFDRNTSTLYIYGEHYMGGVQPVIHAEAIKARGKWIPGVIDPASNGRNQKDGSRLLTDYVNEFGLKLTPAKNNVEAGLDLTYRRLSAGRIKVFRHLGHFQDEFRYYRRDDKGKVIKADDHLMDCLRYLVLSNYAFFAVRPTTIADLGPAPVGDDLSGY